MHTEAANNSNLISESSTITLHLRRAYFLLSAAIIFLSYVIRAFVIDYGLSLNQYRLFGASYNDFSFPFFLSIVISLVWFVGGLCIPRKVVIVSSKRVVNFFWTFFLISSLLTLTTAILSGYVMGGTVSGFWFTSYSMIRSLLPYEPFFVGVMLFRRTYSPKMILFAGIVFVAPYVVIGSKAAFVFLFWIFLGLWIIERQKILTVRRIVFGLAVMLMYPAFSLVSYYLRGDSSLLSLFLTEGAVFEGGHLFSAIGSLSYRINSLDVLTIPYKIDINHEGLLAITPLIYALKGFLGSGIVDLFIPTSLPYGLGRVFAISILGQPESLVNAYEPSILGLAYFSKFPYASVLMIAITLCSVFVLLSSDRSNGGRVVLTFSVLFAPLVIVSGIMNQFGFFLRISIIMALIYILYDAFFVTLDSSRNAHNT